MSNWNFSPAIFVSCTSFSFSSNFYHGFLPRFSFWFSINSYLSLHQTASDSPGHCIIKTNCCLGLHNTILSFQFYLYIHVDFQIPLTIAVAITWTSTFLPSTLIIFTHLYSAIWNSSAPVQSFNSKQVMLIPNWFMKSCTTAPVVLSHLEITLLQCFYNHYATPYLLIIFLLTSFGCMTACFFTSTITVQRYIYFIIGAFSRVFVLHNCIIFLVVFKSCIDACFSTCTNAE